MELPLNKSNANINGDSTSKETVSSKKSIERKRNILSCLLISLHNGLAALSSLAVQFFLKDNLGLSPDQMANLKSLLAVPYLIRPLLALLTDAFPICGYRRKVYILISGLVNLIVCLLISTVVSTYIDTTCCLFVYHLTFCFFSILGDAVLVELAQSSGEEEVSKNMMASFREVRTIGNIISSFLTGYLVENLRLKQIFQICSVLPFLVIISGFMFTEINYPNPNKDKAQVKTKAKASSKNNVELKDMTITDTKENEEIEQVLQQIKHPKINKETLHNSLSKKLFTFLTNSHATIPLLYMVIINALPAYSETFFYYMVNELQLTPSEIGIANTIPLILCLLTMKVYQKYMKKINYKTMMIIGTLATYVVASSLLFLIFEYHITFGIKSFYMIIIIQSLEIIAGLLLLLPFSEFAVLICPPKLEATIYSLFLGAVQFGQGLSQFLGGRLSDYLLITGDNFDNLHLLIIIPRAMSMCILPILCCLSRSYFSPRKRKEPHPLYSQARHSNTNEYMSHTFVQEL